MPDPLKRSDLIFAARSSDALEELIQREALALLEDIPSEEWSEMVGLLGYDGACEFVRTEAENQVRLVAVSAFECLGLHALALATDPCLN